MSVTIIIIRLENLIHLQSLYIRYGISDNKANETNICVTKRNLNTYDDLLSNIANLEMAVVAQVSDVVNSCIPHAMVNKKSRLTT